MMKTEARFLESSCREYQGLTRRRFVGLGAFAMAAVAAPSWLPRVSMAAEAGGRDALVVLFLRGGCDGLSMVVPHGEAAYYRHRPELALPQPGKGAGAVRDLDGFFGLAPSLAPLKDAYEDGQLLFVHGCGLRDASRSHFDAMNFVEVGMPNPPGSLTSGWVGRHLAGMAPAVKGSPLRGVSLDHALPRSFSDGPLCVPVPDAASYGLVTEPGLKALRNDTLRGLYLTQPGPLRDPASHTFDTIRLLDRIRVERYQPSGGAEYPDDELGYALQSAAAILKAEEGVEAVAIDYGGWDTHELQGPVDGFMAYLMTQLAEGLKAFYQDVLANGDQGVTLVVLSEFGRTVPENGSLGTDHGTGNLMMVMGQGIDGGRVLTDWPGLADHDLVEGRDLAITIDYRDILTEILADRLGNRDSSSLFPDPDYSPREWGVVR